MKRYTVKQLADLAGVTRRTLHFYDEKGLLKPAETAGNGYRYYDEAALLRLQQILLYREVGLALEQIKKLLDDPKYDPVTALRHHRGVLQDLVARYKTLIRTVDTTLMHLVGEIDMSEENVFTGFSDEQQAAYELEAVDRWGENAAQSISLWNSYSDVRKAEIMQEGNEIYQQIAAGMGKGAGSSEIRALLVRWHDHLRYFYEPTIEVLGGLGDMYHDHPDFNATFTRIHPDLPAFLKQAIALYVDDLETK